MIAMLDTDIETLTATKNAVEITLVKAAFEAAIVILAVVRASPVLFPLSTSTHRLHD